jgi:hypothetical protein
MQVNYIDTKGNTVYIHGYDDGVSGYCEFMNVLLPMIWVVIQEETMKDFFVKHIRPGYDMNDGLCPFSKWINLRVNGKANVFNLLIGLDDIITA